MFVSVKYGLHVKIFRWTCSTFYECSSYNLLLFYILGQTSKWGKSRRFRKRKEVSLRDFFRLCVVVQSECDEKTIKKEYNYCYFQIITVYLV